MAVSFSESIVLEGRSSFRGAAPFLFIQTECIYWNKPIHLTLARRGLRESDQPGVFLPPHLFALSWRAGLFLELWMAFVLCNDWSAIARAGHLNRSLTVVMFPHLCHLWSGRTVQCKVKTCVVTHQNQKRLSVVSMR